MAFFGIFRGCSYEQRFAFVFPLNRENILLPHVHIWNISAAGRDLLLRACWAGKFWRKPIFKMVDANLKKKETMARNGLNKRNKWRHKTYIFISFDLKTANHNLDCTNSIYKFNRFIWLLSISVSFTSSNRSFNPYENKT